MHEIEDYHINKSEYGIITLIVNTRDKWLDYGGVFSYDIVHKAQGLLIHIKTGKDDWYGNSLFIYEHEFPFDKEKEISYLMSHSQEKDQIYYYWIPLRLIKGDEYVEHFKSKLKNELDK